MSWSKKKAERRAPSPYLPYRHSTPLWVLLLVVSYLFVPTSLHATPLAYVEVFPQELSSATLTHILDKDDTTSWCVSPTSSPARVRFYFKTNQSISTVRLTLTRTPSDPFDISLSNGKVRLSISVSHKKLKVELPNPMQGTHIDLLVGPRDTPTCISTVTMHSSTNNLTDVSGPPSSIRARAPLTGTWKSGPLGNPNTFWTFSLDGTWSWEKKRALLAQSQRLSGTWTLSRDQLVLSVPRQPRAIRLTLARRLVQIDEWAEDAPDANYEEITFTGEFKSVLTGSYHNARYDMLE